MNKNFYLMKKEKENKSNNFIQKLFSCCYENNSDRYDLVNYEERVSIYPEALKELDNKFLIFPAGTIRAEERTKIDFTKDGLFKFIFNLQNLDYETIYNENNIIISKRNSSDISKKVPLIRFQIKKNKSYFAKAPKITKLIEVMANPKIRSLWDDNILEYKIIEKLNNYSEILKIITPSSEIFSGKEFYDKRIRLLKDGVYYLFSSSIPDNNNIISYDYEKGITILSVMIVKADKDFYYFDCFNQIDIKEKLPKDFFNEYLPNKTISFLEKYFEFLNTL